MLEALEGLNIGEARIEKPRCIGLPYIGWTRNLGHVGLIQLVLSWTRSKLGCACYTHRHKWHTACTQLVFRKLGKLASFDWFSIKLVTTGLWKMLGLGPKYPLMFNPSTWVLFHIWYILNIISIKKLKFKLLEKKIS